MRLHPQDLTIPLLGAAPEPEKVIFSKETEEPEKGSCPDAWIYGETFVVLIESKVRDAPLNKAQMQSHRQKLADDKHEPTSLTKTWADVHDFFVTLSADNLLSDKSQWVVEQFTQYLQWQGMSDFTGFDEQMFEFLDASRKTKDPDEQSRIRETMKVFGKKVLAAITLPAYQVCHVGNAIIKYDKDDHFWVTFGRESFTELTRKAHQTISLYDYGLEVLVNLELKPAINLLRKRLCKAKVTFREKIAAIPEPFRIDVVERKRKPTGLRHYDNTLKTTLEAGCLRLTTSSAFDDLEKELLDIPLPYFSLRKRIERETALKLSEGNGDALVQEVVGCMKAFHPLVEFING